MKPIEIRSVRLPAGAGICLTLLVTSWQMTRAYAADAAPTAEGVFDIPRVSAIVVDGDTSDWNGQGLRIETMGTLWARPWPAKRPSPSFALGWDARGLLAHVTVHNPTPHEYDQTRHLFKGDSVEFFLSSTPGSSDRYMLVISPGLDPKYPEPRHCFFPDPSEAGERDLRQMTFSVARRRTADGYTMEVLLPWANLKLQPELDKVLGLQVYVMEAQEPARCLTAMWHPAGESHVDANAVHRIRLSESTAPATAGPLAAFQRHDNRTAVRVVAPAAMAGKQLEVRTDDQMMVGVLSQHDSQATAILDLAGGTAQQVNVVLNGRPLPAFAVPDADNPITVLSSKLHCSMASCVFAEKTFPQAQLSGAPGYRVNKVTYYDAAFCPVQTAEKPGRYGAVIEIADRQGNTALRFRTLFRVPERFRGWSSAAQPLSSLAGILAQDPWVMECIGRATTNAEDGDWIRSTSGTLANPKLASLLAYLDAVPEATAAPKDDFGLYERQWWVQFKRRLYGAEARWAQPLARPSTIGNQQQSVVRIGTEQEAGMHPGTAERIDQICESGAGATGEAVSVCIVRHGVCFFSRAYGQIGDKPMTRETACDIHSASKPVAGTVMMMLCDQGLVVDPNDDLAAYLPPFRKARFRAPLTIRKLYNHQAGFPLAVWDDSTADIEEIVAGFAPALNVGVYRYSDTGYSLAGKLMELVTGEAFPRLARDHLFKPLGMTHTRVFGTGHDVWTTAEDYARLGQLLLNRGTYGNLRFFGEAEYAKMVPGEDPGIGVRATGRAFLGEDAFGHDGSNSSILCVSPSRDLVLVIVSAGNNKAFAEHSGDLLLKTIADSVQDGVPAAAR